MLFGAKHPYQAHAIATIPVILHASLPAQWHKNCFHKVLSVQVQVKQIISQSQTEMIRPDLL